jgi:hypothetical protein
MRILNIAQPFFERLLTIFALALAPPALSAELSTCTIDWAGMPNTHFAGSEVRAALNLSGIPRGARAVWRLAVGPRTLIRGEMLLEEGAEKWTQVPVRLRLPPLEKISPLVADLHAEIIDDSGARLASAARQIAIFDSDIRAHVSARLREAPIYVFDPLERTAARMSECGLVYGFARPDTPLDSTNGVWIIGEGISLDDYPGLAEALFRSAENGLSVVVLAPRQGTVVAPGWAYEAQPVPLRMELKDRTFVTEIHKLLDAETWGSCGSVRASFLCPTRDCALEVAAECGNAGPRWSFVSWEFESGGSLRICTLPMIEKWTCGPVPPYLFLSLLEAALVKETRQ